MKQFVCCFLSVDLLSSHVSIKRSFLSTGTIWLTQYDSESLIDLAPFPTLFYFFQVLLLFSVPNSLWPCQTLLVKLVFPQNNKTLFNYSDGRKGTVNEQLIRLVKWAGYTYTQSCPSPIGPGFELWKWVSRGGPGYLSAPPIPSPQDLFRPTKANICTTTLWTLIYTFPIGCVSKLSCLAFLRLCLKFLDMV